MGEDYEKGLYSPELMEEIRSRCLYLCTLQKLWRQGMWICSRFG